jgi:type I restriction enzyme S subunit
MWPAGTLCITIAANIAATAILGFDACFPDSVVGFLPNYKTNSAYIRILLSFLRPVIEKSAPQLAQKNINLKILRELTVPLPPKDVQDEFMILHDNLLRFDEKREISTHNIDILFNTLLQRTFTGNLTAKWREAHMKEVLAEMEMQARELKQFSKIKAIGDDI